MFRGSLVPAWLDGIDNHESYDVDLIVQDMDLVDELDISEWKDFIHQRHAEDGLFFADPRSGPHTFARPEGWQDALPVSSRT